MRNGRYTPGGDWWRGLITDDGLFSVDSRQRLSHWSESAERLLGYGREEVVGRPCYDVVGGRDERNYRFCRLGCPVMVNARRGRPTPDYDVVCRVAGGEERWLNVTVAVDKRGRGDLQVLHFFRDVTRRRSVEEFARRAASALRDLLGDQEGSGEAVEPSPTPAPRLSNREQEVLRLLASGMTTRQIADTLCLSGVTARNHVTRLLNKLGVENRLQAVVYASERRLV